MIDPGPADPAHLDAVASAVEARGGLGGIALTHRHADHAAGVEALRSLTGAAPLAAARGPADLVLVGGERFGPLETLALPGHSRDHLGFLLATPAGPICFSGDAVLGEGYVFVAPGAGALRAYLDGLARLRARAPVLLCPGHGPVVEDAVAKLEDYLAHRLARERALLDALADGRRRVDELLDAAWADTPPLLRPAAAVVLAAHLDKLDEEGRLPADVERPRVPEWLLAAEG